MADEPDRERVHDSTLCTCVYVCVRVCVRLELGLQDEQQACARPRAFWMSPLATTPNRAPDTAALPRLEGITSNLLRHPCRSIISRQHHFPHSLPNAMADLHDTRARCNFVYHSGRPEPCPDHTSLCKLQHMSTRCWRRLPRSLMTLRL